ncbi:hypothetical protein TNCV_1249031 [Trichonephila clavipes]|nr:hypothetical protein TNCV_1249031 [Trichonephila clavipes]
MVSELATPLQTSTPDQWENFEVNVYQPLYMVGWSLNTLALAPTTPQRWTPVPYDDHLSTAESDLYSSESEVAVAAEWSRYRIMAGLVTSSSPVP